MKDGTRFYFMRHGETYFNYYGYMQGWGNAPLTPRGKERVVQTGKALKNKKFDAIYTSDLTRTRETARIILDQNEKTPHDLPMIEFPEFREVFFGSFEGRRSEKVFQSLATQKGLSVEEFRQLSDPERMLAMHEADPYHDAETFDVFWERVERGLLKIMKEYRHENANILIVAHGSAIRHILANIVPDFDESAPLDNTAVSLARYTNGQFVLDYYNKTDNFDL